MTTGVDAQTCKLIVLDSVIKSMTEFKQIIGRGTRINEEYGKTFFTIMDFRNVTDLFADTAFDGEPVMIKEIKGEEEITKNDVETGEDEEHSEEAGGTGDNGKEKIQITTIVDGGPITTELRPKVYVAGVDVSILNERVQYMDQNGKLITGSLKDYTKKNILKEFRTIDDFLTRWNKADKKKALIEELEESGILIANLKEEVKKDLDLFDLICHIAWDMPAFTRKERAENVKKRNYFTKYGEKARNVIEALLDKYADEGIENIEELSVLRVEPFNQMGTPVEIVNIFGGKENYVNAIKELENELYKVA
jgi:type I restriction enzyme R subunit